MGAVMDLTIDAMRSKEEAKLKSILAALWHLSANSDDNKAEICAVEGALAFLVDMLDYDAPSKSVIVAENASGVLKNVSSHVATRDDYKAILREKHCVPVLIKHLKSHSTVLVNNVCGILCNLSKYCLKDQQILLDSILDSQSIPILQNLTQSKHKMISTNASVLLRNLLSAKCHNSNLNVGLAVSITGVIQTHNAMSVAHKDVNINVRGCADKENAKIIKRNLNKDMTYSANQSFVSINTRMVDNYKVLNNRTDVRYNQSMPEKSEQRKIKYYHKQSLKDENYDPRKLKEEIRTSAPLNSPPESDSFIRLRPCSSPVDENPPLIELLDNNDDVTSNCIINEISPVFGKRRYQTYMQNGSSHHTSPIYDLSANKGNPSFDEDASDQPVDYSKKYIERNAALSSNVMETGRPERPGKKDYSVHRSKVNLFGDYAETDIDQPTNYSLRYAEDDTDEDEKPNREYFAGSEQEDTVQTYCTEGTPYQTPFTFSTATSMSDLREDAKDKEESKTAKRAKDSKPKETAPSLGIKALPNCDERQPSTAKDSKNLSVLNMDIMSPEKPINYCEEGTPGYFSRVSSLSSLNSALVSMNITGTETATEKGAEALSENCENKKIIDDKEVEKFISTADHSSDHSKNASSGDKDVAKSVSFGAEGHCNETPLMFSRCSSLSSLSGFEQHSIPEDRSSTYDFSRRTSGLISPSEIPDSPTQTVPPSPKHHKTLCAEFARKIHEEKSAAKNISSSKPLVAMRSIFEDEISTYKEESTPIEFSAATSLSSLTIDDDVPRILDDSKERIEESMEEKNTEERKDAGKVEEAAYSDKEPEQVSDPDEDDEDILAACINMGMRNNRYRQSSKKTSQKPAGASPNFPKYQTCPAINCKDSTIPSTKPSSNAVKSKPSVGETAASPDTVHVYCTEDTPADISPVGSHSNLSALSLASIPDYDEDMVASEQHKILQETERKDELSDESSNLSGDEEKLLDKCIQSGMPKERQKVASSIRGSSISVNKKSENKFKRCGTPSTSPVEPVPEPTASSALCPQYTTPVPEIETEIFDDSSNHSEDEAILAECIKSAMPKERSTTSISVMQCLSPSDPKLHNAGTATTNLCRCPAMSPLRPNYLEPVSHLKEKPRMERFERNLSLSEEEEDMMLAQCIKSGMPKAQKSGASKNSSKNWKKS